jgi:SsrA-binding protein
MSIKVIVNNRRAFHEYTVEDKFEAGIALTGTEVKSLRAGKCNLSDGWVDIEHDEAILKEVQISPYTEGNRFNHAEKRPRKLLLHKKEIQKLLRKISEKGYTVVPLKVYFKENWIKVEIALARGKKLHDKRDASKKKDSNREIARAMRGK